MWTRAELKENAKKVLSKFYWTAFLVCLIASFLGVTITAGGGSGGSVGGASSGSSNYSQIKNEMDASGSGLPGSFDLDDSAVAQIIAIVAFILVVYFAILLIVLVISTVYKTFVSNIVECGMYRYFQNIRSGGENNVMDVFSSFTGGRYMKTVKNMFFAWLYEALWSLLFIIPGIIKHYSYYLVKFITVENPDIDTKRAFEISKSVMDGQKWNVFVLELSFIGWYFLAIFTCGLGFLFLNPYVAATRMEFYEKIKEIAISEGKISPEELSVRPLEIA